MAEGEEEEEMDQESSSPSDASPDGGPDSFRLRPGEDLLHHLPRLLNPRGLVVSHLLLAAAGFGLGIEVVERGGRPQGEDDEVASEEEDGSFDW